MNFVVGDRVNRIEDREITGATVLEVDRDVALIAYDEGGEGYWSFDSLEKI
jgi:hypothetical protein